MKTLLLAGAATLALCLPASPSAARAPGDPAPAAARDEDPKAPPTVSPVVVTAAPLHADAPNTTASITAETVDRTISTVTVEDALRYLPDVLIRQRHIGDTQDPITTRTSGVGSSARTLIYADGILLSALFGNNNSTASPRWGLVSPDEIARIDVLYGPFSAAYPGNSIGAVVEITTRTPDRLEATAEVQGAVQSFRKFGDDETLGTGRFAATLGDRVGRFSLFASYNHLDTQSQPLSYATIARPTATSTAGAPTLGGVADASRTGSPILVLGSTGNEHQVQDNATLKLGYDLTPTLTAGYRVGVFHNDDVAKATSYLSNASGQPVYAGALNIGGRAYSVAASAFSSGVYRQEETMLAQGLTLASHTQGVFDYEIVASRFDYLTNRQRLPSTALPAANAGGAGSLVSLDGTGWWTFDAKGTWRPFGVDGAHVVSFGAHDDVFQLDNPRYALSDWLNGAPGATTTLSRGRTQTWALWGQDVMRLGPAITLTVGGRYEHFRASNGLNVSTAPALNVAQPALEHDSFSPKAVLAATPWEGWTFRASVGVAYRYPTVTELYQAITTGVTLTSPNPDLRPERAVSTELSAERAWNGGKARLSLFGERIDDALLSQSATLVPGSGTLFSYVQNVDRVSNRGIELVAQQDRLPIPHLSLSGWITYVRSNIDEDRAFPAAVGKDLPQLPRLRGAVVVAWSPLPRFDLTLAARYSDRAFATIDNSDAYADTYQGFGAFFVVDAKARYRINPHLTAEVGVDNLNDRSYFVFHPFPQRTVIASLKASY